MTPDERIPACRLVLQSVREKLKGEIQRIDAALLALDDYDSAGVTFIDRPSPAAEAATTSRDHLQVVEHDGAVESAGQWRCPGCGYLFSVVPPQTLGDAKFEHSRESPDCAHDLRVLARREAGR